MSNLVPNPYELPTERTEPWKVVSEEDVLAVTIQFAEQLAKRYGIDTLRKIDEANKFIPEPHDSVYDFIDMTELFQEYMLACDALGFKWNNSGYAYAFRVIRKDGYVFHGDNYEC